MITGGAVIIMCNDDTGREICGGGGWDIQRHDMRTNKKTDRKANSQSEFGPKLGSGVEV